MKLTAESTDRIVRVNDLEARVWQAKTETGTPCTLFVVRVQVRQDRTAEFERELIEQPPKHIEWDPSIPLRLVV